MDKLIYDRTLQDVQPTTRTYKGYYNISDIERINSYIDYLASELDLDLPKVSITFGQALTTNILGTIISNVNELRKAWYVAEDTPATPVPSGWDYNKANAIEKILQHLYDFMVSAKTDNLYSGTFMAGGQIKFRGDTL